MPRRLLEALAEIVVALFIVVDALVAPLFRPVMRALSRLQLIRRLERWIGAMHPYVILVLLGVPFAIAEFTKVFGVFLMSEGHYRTGMTLFIGAYVVSILVCERIFHAGKRQLMTIGWFAVGYRWLMAFKDKVLDWFRETRIWQASADVRRGMRAAMQRLKLRLRSAFGMKPRSIYER